MEKVIDEKTVSPRPVGIRYGLISGLISIASLLVFNMLDLIDYSGQKSNIISNIISALTTLGITYWALNEHKMQALGGFISTGRCLSVGFWIGLVSGLISAIGTYAYFAFIDPELLNEILSVSAEQMEAKGMDSAQIDQAIEFTKIFVSPAMMGMFSFIFSIIFYVAAALIISFFIKKESKSPFDTLDA
jgi:hypothetical protein